MSSQYNYPEILTWLEQKAKQDYGLNFHFVEEDLSNITMYVFKLNWTFAKRVFS